MRTVRNVIWLTTVTVALAACATPPSGSAADFGFSLEDTSLAAVPGTSITTSTTITPINGFTGIVDLTIANQDGSPADPGISLDPSGITVMSSRLAQQAIEQLTIEVDSTVINATYELRITASSDSLTSDADLTLIVTDTLEPQATITGPNDGDVITGSRKVTLTGTLASLSPIIAVDVVGDADLKSLAFDQNTFTAVVELENNANSVAIVAMDGDGGVGTSPAITLSYPFLELADFQAASVVVGQPDFFSSDSNQGGATAANTVANELGSPFVTDSGVLFVPDSDNNRVLGFNQIPTSNDASADFVLGQPFFTTANFGTSATTFFTPGSIHSDGIRLVVSDLNNNRILLWNAIPTTNQVPADVVIGQPDFVTNTSVCAADSLSSPGAAILAGGKLIVADVSNDRVLIWNMVPTSNGEPADVVLGQNSFTTCVENDDDQNGVDDGAPTARTLSGAPSVWSDGTRLAVADFWNHRVSIWDDIPTSNFTPADLVLGQPDFVTATLGTDAQTFNFPNDVFSNGNQLFVVEAGNNRILVFDDFPSVSGEAADRVLGQATFTNGTHNDDDQDGVADANPTARTLDRPQGLFAFEGTMIVNDGDNFRFSIFESQ